MLGLLSLVPSVGEASQFRSLCFLVRCIVDHTSKYMNIVKHGAAILNFIEVLQRICSSAPLFYSSKSCILVHRAYFSGNGRRSASLSLSGNTRFWGKYYLFIDLLLTKWCLDSSLHCSFLRKVESIRSQVCKLPAK